MVEVSMFYTKFWQRYVEGRTVLKSTRVAKLSEREQAQDISLEEV